MVLIHPPTGPVPAHVVGPCGVECLAPVAATGTERRGRVLDQPRRDGFRVTESCHATLHLTKAQALALGTSQKQHAHYTPPYMRRLLPVGSTYSVTERPQLKFDIKCIFPI